VTKWLHQRPEYVLSKLTLPLLTYAESQKSKVMTSHTDIEKDVKIGRQAVPSLKGGRAG
jgi:hypothetical protein